MLILYGPLVTAIKLSVLLQYLNIFASTRRLEPMYAGCHLVIWTHVILYTVYNFFEIFICNPRKKFWNPLEPGHCFNAETSNIAAAAFNAAADFFILLLPQPTIWNSQMPRRRKIGISTIFFTRLL